MPKLAKRVNWFAISDVGLVREQNEDSWAVLPESGIFALADGMGGHKAGEIASSVACEKILYYFENTTISNPKEALYAAFQLVNRTIYELGAHHEEYSGMGTTLDCLLLNEKKAFFGHVGDSRIYHFRDKKLNQLTQDHTLANELLRLGTISKHDVEHLPYRHTLTRAIGKNPTVDLDMGACDYQYGDLFLLCSDGLVNFAKESEIISLLQSNSTLEEKANSLISLAKAHGGGDNITVVLISIDDLPR